MLSEIESGGASLSREGVTVSQSCYETISYIHRKIEERRIEKTIRALHFYVRRVKKAEALSHFKMYYIVTSTP
jgi:hypothetical protein